MHLELCARAPGRGSRVGVPGEIVEVNQNIQSLGTICPPGWKLHESSISPGSHAGGQRQAVADKRISARSLGWWQIVTAGKGVRIRILWFALGVEPVRKRSERDYQPSELALKTLRRRSTLWYSCIQLRPKAFHSCIVMRPAEKSSVLKG